MQPTFKILEEELLLLSAQGIPLQYSESSSGHILLAGDQSFSIRTLNALITKGYMTCTHGSHYQLTEKGKTKVDFLRLKQKQSNV